MSSVRRPTPGGGAQLVVRSHKLRTAPFETDVLSMTSGLAARTSQRRADAA